MTETRTNTDFGLQVQPMAHVERLPESIRFYELLGGRLVYGSRDGDWALLQFGDSMLSLLAHAPSADHPEPVELQFVSTGSLDRIASHMKAAAPSCVERELSDEAFGRMLRLRTPDGLVIKLLEIERDLLT